MKNLPTVTIGIPAYNEEANIKILIENLLNQKQGKFVLQNIVVVSDGSTDNTVNLVKSLNNNKIRIIDRKQRLGGRKSKSEIMRLSDSDILVVFDADILPVNNLLLENLIEPILKDGISLVGANTIPLTGKSYFEKIIAYGHLFKKQVYMQINNGDNVYLCHGRGRAFSKTMYKIIGDIPTECPEDAYSYLLAKSKGLNFAFKENAKTYFRATSDFKQRESQSKRFLVGKSMLKKYFSDNLVDSEFKIPVKYLLSALFSYGIKHPLLTICYFSWIIYIKLSKHKKQDNNKWQMATSSKKLI